MPSQFHSLQAVRGVACLMVWGLHLAVWEGMFGASRPLAPLLRFGFAGVDLFFVLSGFLIAHTQGKHAGRPAAVPGYLFRRCWRVYPTYWAVFALAAAVGVWGLGHGYEPAAWGEWLALWPHAGPNVVLPCAWTLNLEVLFYLAFAVVVVAPRPWGAVLLLGWGVAIGVAAVCGIDGRTIGNVSRHLLSPFVWEFLLGCGIAWGVGRGWSRCGWLVAVGGVAWAAAGILVLSSKAEPFEWAANEFLRAAVCGPAAGLVVYGLAAAEVRTGFVPPRWLRAVGDASYSIYLWHLPAGSVVFHFTTWWPHTTLPHAAWLLLMTTAGVGGGLLFHRLVERPLLGVVKRPAKSGPGPGRRREPPHLQAVHRSRSDYART